MTQADPDPVAGCLSVIALLGVMALAFFFVSLNWPLEPRHKGFDACDDHGGFAELQGSMIDLFQHEGTVACKDGTVRWVEW